MQKDLRFKLKRVRELTEIIEKAEKELESLFGQTQRAVSETNAIPTIEDSSPTWNRDTLSPMHADILTIIDRAGGTASARDIYRSIQQSNPEMRKDKVLSALSYMANPKRANSIERVRKGLFKLKVR